MRCYVVLRSVCCFLLSFLDTDVPRGCLIQMCFGVVWCTTVKSIRNLNGHSIGQSFISEAGVGSSTDEEVASKLSGKVLSGGRT